MTQEDKELLLKDLCARLPYRVKVLVDDNGIETIEIFEGFHVVDDYIDNVTCFRSYTICDIDEIKPYLFPLSSMTEEQREEFNSFFTSVPYYGNNDHEHVVPYYFVELLIEFFHKNHIDNNGLIEKGLALDAT